MSRLSARHIAARLLLALPVLALASCGGDQFGAIVTVPNAVVAADLNGDGAIDVAVAVAQIDETGLTQKPGLLRISINSKSSPGTFAGPANYVTSSSPPSGLAVGDLSGTGSHDMVVANLNAGTIAVLMETSPTSGTYAAAKTINVGGEPNDVQIADINGDGLPDLIVADNTGKVTYLLQSSANPGTFAPGVSLPITNRAISVAVGDLNHDGHPDLAVTSFDVNGDGGLVTIYFQDPNNPGTFLPTPTVITASGEPSQILIADVNQDGSPDLVIACQGLGYNSSIDPTEAVSGAMVILQNAGSPGTFATPIVYGNPPDSVVLVGTISLAVGDLNADGLPDIAMTGIYPQGQGSIAVLLQDPAAAGTFMAAAVYPGNGQPVSIVIGDVDNDGLPDLVLADSTDAVWMQNQRSAPGTFIAEPLIGL